MSDDEIRDRLEVAMMSSARGNTYAQWADTILPTVRAIAAAELRAAADDWAEALPGVASQLRDRADELDPS